MGGYVMKMKIWMVSLIILCVSLANVGAAPPDYAKWGALAMKETQKRYSADDIIDYKHIGHSDIASNKTEEKFKLWLRSKDGREFGVYVTIQFDPSNDNVHKIHFNESE